MPVATLNDVQVVNDFPIESNDLPLTVIATPTNFRVDSPPQPPDRIEWDRLTTQDLEDMPVKELRT